MRILVVAFALTVAAPRPACAYLDPGAGSLMLQLLLGGVAGLAVIARLYWRRIMAFLGVSRKARGRGSGSPGQGRNT